MVEMWYGGILQLKPIVWAVEMKATSILKKIRAGNKPGSVPLQHHQGSNSRTIQPFSWLKRGAATIYLGLTLPSASSVLPNRRAGRPLAVLFGLAAGGVCTAGPVTRTAVGSYPAISPLPVFPEKPSAVCFLLHYPLVRTIWPLASTLPYVARTFLQSPGIKTKPESQRSRVRL